MPSEPRSESTRAPYWYSYAILRVVPRIERGEFVNVGVILFVRTIGFLETRLALDEVRLRAITPGVDLESIKRHLDTFEAISAGAIGSGLIADQPPSERFHWLTSPRSTMIQTSPIHVGWCVDPTATLDELLDIFVRPPEPA